MPSVSTATEERKAEADARPTAAKENNKSDEARAAHSPDEHAAPEAFAADENAAHRESRNEKRDLQQENRKDHGTDPASDEQN